MKVQDVMVKDVKVYSPTTNLAAVAETLWKEGCRPMPAPACAKEAPIKTLSLKERIRRRAHELYIRRGRQSGSELDDWLQAEQEIRRAEQEACDQFTVRFALSLLH